MPMFLRRLSAIVATCLIATAAPAATPEELARLSEAMRTADMVSILRDEGLAESIEIAAETFPGPAPASWGERMARIYDPDRVTALFEKHFFAAMEDADVTPLITFFESELGARIIGLEISGRRAFISDDVEEAAREAWGRDDDAARADQLARFIEVNDLLERNVSGALNSTLAFYEGLSEAEIFAMSEEDMLRDVWAQEAEIRDDTEGWLYAYLAMTYEPLQDAELESYIDLSQTDAGQAMNAALFQAFDQVFDDVSYRVGATIAQLSGGQEL